MKIQSFIPIQFSTLCPISLHFTILDPLPCLPRLGQLLHLPQLSFPRPTALSPSTFDPLSYFLDPLCYPLQPFSFWTHRPISLNFSILDPLHYLPQTSQPRPTIRPLSTSLSSTHGAIPLIT